jgi:hypothetical protein
MAAHSCKACECLILGALWVVEKTGQGVAGGARWIRSRVIDASSEPNRPDPDD